MKAEDRCREILSLVQTKKSVQLDELVEKLGVSRMTIHRDLDLLASRGLLRKERGGATAESSLLFESNFHYRQQIDQDEKRDLAKAASALVEPGNVVMVDDSTTTLLICDEIKDIENLTVITNSLAVCERLRGNIGMRLILTGGTYNDTLQGFYGLMCETTLGKLKADWAFVSASSAIGTGLYHQDQDVVRLKRALMAAAEHAVLLLTAKKFKTRALNYFADIGEFSRVFIDKSLDEESAKSLRQAGVSFDLV